MTDPKPRAVRDTTLSSVDKQAPAYRIIYGVFGGLTPFTRTTGVPKSTAHLWLVNGHIPTRRQAHIRAKAAELGLDLDPVLFVPEAAAA